MAIGSSRFSLVRYSLGLALLPAIIAAGPATSPAHAQDPEQRWEAFRLQRQFLEAWRVRLYLSSGDMLQGRVHTVAENQLIFQDDSKISLDDVDLAHALTPRTRPYALRGGIMGAALASVLSVSVSLAAGEGVWAGLGNGLLPGVGVGMVAGAILGRRSHDEEDIYRSPLPDGYSQRMITSQYWVRRRGAVRTNIAVTPFVGLARYSVRVQREAVGMDGFVLYQFGIAPSREIGIRAQYALGPRGVARASVSRIQTEPMYSFSSTAGLHGFHVDKAFLVPPHIYNMIRGEAGLELRMRSNVPGYFLLTVDGIYNPVGYVLGLADQTFAPTGADAGTILPRLGFGIGYDIFLPDDRRVRWEWTYHLGHYHLPGLEHLYDPNPLTRDWSFTIGVHLPVLQPYQHTDRR